MWRLLEDEVVPAIVQLKTLAPGEVLDLRAEWNQRTNQKQRVAPGLYSVRGVLLTDSPVSIESDAVELRILPK